MLNAENTITGNPHVDLVLDAGPRTFGPDIPKFVRDEIAKAPALGWYRASLATMKRLEVAKMHRAITMTSRENRLIEKELKATNGIGVPSHRIPMDVYYQMQDLWGHGCWKDDDFTEDFLKHHPGLRLKVTRGTRGQSYEGSSRYSLSVNRSSSPSSRITNNKEQITPNAEVSA